MMEDGTNLEVELDDIDVINGKYKKLEIEEEEEETTCSSSMEEDINLDRFTWYVPQDVAYVILSFLEVREIIACQRISSSFLKSGRSDYLWGTVIGNNINRYEVPFKEYKDFHIVEHKSYDTLLLPFRRLFRREKEFVYEATEEMKRQNIYRKERGDVEFKRRYISLMIGFFGSIVSFFCECVRCPFEILIFMSLCSFCCVCILCSPFSILSIICLLCCLFPFVVFVSFYLCSVSLFFHRSQNLGLSGEGFYDMNVDPGYRNWLRFMYTISQAVDKTCCCCFLHCGMNLCCQLCCILFHGTSLNIFCFTCCWCCYFPLFAFLNVCCCPLISLFSVLCTWSGFLVSRICCFLFQESNICSSINVREDIEIYICLSPFFWMEMATRWLSRLIRVVYCADDVYNEGGGGEEVRGTIPLPTSYPEEFKRWWNDKMKKIFFQ